MITIFCSVYARVCTTFLSLFLHEPKKNWDQSLIRFKKICVFIYKFSVPRSSFNGAFPPNKSREFNCDIISLLWSIYPLKGMFVFLWCTCMANLSSISANSSREQILKMYFLNYRVYIVQIKGKLIGCLGKKIKND